MAVKMDVTILDAVVRTGTVIAETAIGDDTTTLLITPTKHCSKLVFILTNGGASYTVDVAKGDFWAGRAMTQITMGGSTKRVFVFEAAESFKWEENAAGTESAYRIKITLGAAATTTTTYLCIQLS